MKALISIDYTNDFVADDGALTTGKAGQTIEQAMASLAESFTRQGEFVVYAIDAHEQNDPYHPEAKLFPPHNIMGTPGRALYGTLQDVYDQSRHQPHVYWLNKRRYSAFSGTDLDIRLRERHKIGRAHV